MKRNITDACLNCVFNSKDIKWCAEHCEMAQNVLADIEYKRRIKEVYRSGDTHADPKSFKYADTDSVHITSKDEALCMYDYAPELLSGNVEK